MFNNIRSIILMQIMVAVACWFTMWLWNPFSKPIADRLDALPEHTHQHLVEQMKLYTSTQQLPQKEEQKIMEELALLQRSLKWDCPEKPIFYPRIQQDNIIPVDMKWSCNGELLFLPIFMEGIHRLSARGILQSLHIDFSKKEMNFQVRFVRAELSSPDWITDKKGISAKDKALLRQGWMLMYWKSFRVVEEKRENEIDDDIFMMELSRTLTEYRNTNSQIDWSQQKGFIERNF